MPRSKLLFFCQGLFLCAMACGSHSALAQAPARPTSTPAQTTAAVKARVTENVVDGSIADDKSVEKILSAYSGKVRELDLKIGKLKGDLRKGGVGAGSLGNFVTDAMRFEATRKLGKPVVLAVTNSGGLRKSVIAEGDLRSRDIFELMPFENALVAFDLTGAQVLDLLRVVVSGRDAQSGAVIKYGINGDKRPKLESAWLLIDGSQREIDPAAIYTVVSIDYLLNVTGGDYSLLRTARNIQPVGLTLRDTISQYAKRETAAGREIVSALDGRFISDKPASGQEPQP
ncbi:MAG: 5'-nucleotidase C-terminal domain-containing protein [Pyrinomonadaceae bacterium]